MKLTWSRTVIGGKTEPYDFAASDGDVKVGRIYKHTTHGGPANWFWAMNASGPGIDRSRAQCTGLAGRREEAVAAVERAWEACRPSE